MLSVVAAVGYAIATTGSVSRADIAKGANDAIQKAKEQAETKK
jgi:hypothetical protein